MKINFSKALRHFGNETEEVTLYEKNRNCIARTNQYYRIKYTYDAFGTLIQGNLTGTTDFGYLGKQNDPTANIYNYGYRDYKPAAARFTTVDPIRDGDNWFAYCNGDPVNFVDLWGLEVCDKQKPIHGHLLRVEESYTTVGGMNKDKRGKDLLIVENSEVGESVMIPVSSVANMEGTHLSDSLDEKDFVLTYDPYSTSKYAPDVFTITEGTLIPKIPYAIGETLKKNGTTKSSQVPWRGHNTMYWGSEGCITGQTGNKAGDYTDVIKKLTEWGITDKFDIPMSFGLGTY